MGAVYLAEDETLGRRVAIKVTSGAFAEQGDARVRFLREARLMASVEHPRIVRIYAFGESSGYAFLVMEYVDGETLAQKIKRAGPLPVSEALSIVRQTVEALAAAHQQQVVHRDIKPSNVLLDSKGEARVADFGLAKSVQPDETALTESGWFVGTTHYASPEQAQGHAIDFRTDIYSLGIVLYEMLTGKRPFDGATPYEVLDQQRRAPLPSLLDKSADVPDEVVSLVEWMTQKNPDDRPASYAALLEAIDAADTHEPVAQRRLPRKGSRATWAGIAAALAGVLGLAWLTWTQVWRTPAPRDDKRLVVAVTPFYGPDVPFVLV